MVIRRQREKRSVKLQVYVTERQAAYIARARTARASPCRTGCIERREGVVSMPDDVEELE